MSGRLEFVYGFSDVKTPESRKKRGTMRLLLMGDFSGRANRGVTSHDAMMVARPIPAVDVDNFNQVMSRLSPRLRLWREGVELDLEFNELDDFHPDRLYQKLDLFQSLRQLRDRLSDDKTFVQAVAQLQPQTGLDSASSAAQTENDEAMLERLLGKETLRQGTENRRGADSIDQFIRHIVAPHIVPALGENQSVYIRYVDETISTQMRRLLHDPVFQALEAAWRSVYRLVTGLETGEELRLYLLDVSKDELMADIQAAGKDLPKSGLYQKLVEQGVRTPGGEPWSLLAGDYSFSGSADDISLLSGLGAIAAHAGGPFLATASAELLGCNNYKQTATQAVWKAMDKETEANWQALRNSPVASWIGLALPRLVLRLPYGRNLDEIDRFEFEEMPVLPGNHEDFLWGSPAYADALLLAAGFQRNGWSSQPGDLLDIEDLPVIVYDEAGERQMMPCAEAWLSERMGEAMLEFGLMPLLSYRNRNAVRLMRFQSIAQPLRELSGPWS